MRRRNGFTLVELLVVIGIIAVLISILLPTLASARRHVQALKCMANLRSIGQGLSAYVQQTGYYPIGSNGWIGTDPEVVTPNRTGAYITWPASVRLYLSGNRSVFRCPARDDRFEWGPDQPRGYGDPGLTFPPDTGFGYEPGERLLGLRDCFSYGYNAAGRVNETSPYDPDNSRPSGLGPMQVGTRWALVKPNLIHVPSDMIAVADTILNQGTPNNSPGAIIGPFPGMSPEAVHFGGANVLFCDGHVSWYQADDLVEQSGALGVNNAANLCRWNRNHRP